MTLRHGVLNIKITRESLRILFKDIESDNNANPDRTNGEAMNAAVKFLRFHSRATLTEIKRHPGPGEFNKIAFELVDFAGDDIPASDETEELVASCNTSLYASHQVKAVRVKYNGEVNETTFIVVSFFSEDWWRWANDMGEAIREALKSCVLDGIPTTNLAIPLLGWDKISEWLPEQLDYYNNHFHPMMRGVAVRPSGFTHHMTRLPAKLIVERSDPDYTQLGPYHVRIVIMPDNKAE